MELRQLEYFVAVAEELNFTRAAERLHVVQSGVSATLKALERELGVPLLDRSSRRVALTDAGAALLPKARAALDAVEDARDAVGEVAGGLRGTLRIGTLTSIAVIDLPALLGRYHRLHPRVALRLTAAPSGSGGLAAALAEGALDLAFVSLPGQPPAGVRLRELASAPMDLVVPAGHRLAERTSVALTELAGEWFVDFPAGYGNRTVTDRAFAAAGLDRQVAIEITDIATAAAFVRQGLGIALLPRFIVPRRDDVRQLTVTGADLRWPLSLAVSRNRRLGAAAQALVAMATGAAAVDPAPPETPNR
ncbi:LysR substrate-binding domain-containing protein [Streptomyces sp. NBC_01476]|uniref:LysR family transcriptional regulator n=1 Tax=Streptomyces sp. NBC_01476 TaxID=2903881 RepID=UPI002E32BAEF|nr:LysR substrate-binding domain-containing protein [Streptomyces sp. NBC_01476]